MDEAQRAAWDKFYIPIIDDFYKPKLQRQGTSQLEISALCAIMKTR